MKKLIISIIAGAVLIGIGIGIAFVELSEYTMSETLTYITEQPAKEYTYKDYNIFKNSDNNPITIQCSLGSYFYTHKNVIVVEDKDIEGIEINIKYKGIKPSFNFYSIGYENTYRLYSYNEYISPSDILNVAKYIFENKKSVQHIEFYYVDEVIIKTNRPDLIIT